MEAAARAGLQAAKSKVQGSTVTVVGMFVLPFVISCLALRATVNKDSVQNYTILSLIITASYLLGAVLYVFLLLFNKDCGQDTLLLTILVLAMICAGVLVSTGGATTLAWDAESTIKNRSA